MKKMLTKSSVAALCMYFATSAFFFASCKKNDSGTGSGSANTTIKITDAAIDDANVSAAMVTISDIKLDGQSVQGFSKTTIDLAAYQNGSTKTLGNFNLEGKTYNSITFVLDLDADASGAVPGCYVVTAGSVKHKLSATISEITVTKNFTLKGGASNSIVADFDLRKLITHQSGGGADQFDFVSASELQTGVRLVVENQSSTITGTLTDNISGSAKVVVYAYKKGTFDRATEVQGQGQSNIQCKNAVSSAAVSNSGAYELHFLEAGDYELHFASYKDNNSDGQFELNGTLIVVGSGGLDLLGLTLNINAALSANATVTGVLL